MCIPIDIHTHMIVPILIHRTIITIHQRIYVALTPFLRHAQFPRVFLFKLLILLLIGNSFCIIYDLHDVT